jgi:hypothetical protein
LVGKKSLQILTESVNGLKESWETEERWLGCKNCDR